MVMKDILHRVASCGEAAHTKKHDFSKVELRKIVCKNKTDEKTLEEAFKNGYIGRCCFYGFRLTKRGFHELVRLEASSGDGQKNV